MMLLNEIQIYTDGGCSPNPGQGGCACILIYNDHRKELSLGFKNSTNSRMEIMAVILALESLKRKDIKITIHADAKYIVDSFNKGWVFNWEQQEFYNRLNSDLWIRLLSIYRTFKQIEFVWIKAHNGNIENEKCDKLVNAKMREGVLEDLGYSLK